MKKIFALAVLAGVITLAVRAQTGATATVAAPGATTGAKAPKVEAQTEITSAHFFFDGNKNQATYSDHVVVLYPNIKLTCDELVIDVPSQGQPTNIVAKSNVVVNYLEHNRASLITSDKAIYSYSVVNGVTNEPLTFTGHARYEDDKIVQTGEPIVYDCITHNVTIANPVTRPKKTPSMGSGTNAMPFNFLK